MRYIECPQIYTGKETSLFLGGGITGCSNWQKDLVSLLSDTNLVLLNPRRENFDINDRHMEEEQIKWEFEHLLKASAVSFWFTKETLCPITLYELGKQIVSNKPVFLGIHPEYARKRDLEIQTRLIRPNLKISYSLSDLSEEIKNWSKNYI
jgi:hypothetical protein